MWQILCIQLAITTGQHGIIVGQNEKDRRRKEKEKKKKKDGPIGSIFEHNWQLFGHLLNVTFLTFHKKANLSCAHN